MPNTLTPREHLEKELRVLVNKFERNRDDYLRADYSESDARSNLIDPLFEALGWDMRDAPGKGAEREVIRERSEKAGRSDYRFRAEGRTLFFVEAKKPHAPLDNSVVLQAKKYAWSNSDEIIYFTVVTNFKEFALYDASCKPDAKYPLQGQIFELSYKQYLTGGALDNLLLLARSSVPASLDKLIKPAQRTARERNPLDKQFLGDLTTWREKLAKAVFKEHPHLTPADLNRIVQTFLDRLIFIRVAEDRGILAAGNLYKIADKWAREGKLRPIGADLFPLFREVNDKLNGEIFKTADVESIHWDSALVTDIIKEDLEPYDFTQIPVELLGSIYERYLGKTIRVTETRAIVDDKPEVRKAGGVYYTPKYIVDYIVAQTVGKLIEGKTPKQIEKLKILDPACGSGSFLLGAYQTLLDYHARYYAEQGKGKKANQSRLIAESAGGEFKLSLEQKAQILRNNIYGVDIDAQAVEITMMSLYIKMLEGERGAITGQGILPRLRDNIKCGNSLIGYDIGNLSDDERARINPFDWNSQSEGFGEIMAAGRFDAVIGNPPYGIIFAEANKKYLENRYPTFVRNNDMYVVFTQRAIELLRTDALLGFIIPNTFLLGPYFDDLKSYILEQSNVLQIVDFGINQVFPKPNVFTLLLFLQRRKAKVTPQNITQFAKVAELNSFPNSIYFQSMTRADLDLLHWTPANTIADKLLRTDFIVDKLAWVKDVGLNYWTEGRGKTRGGSIADRVLYEGEQIHSKDKPYLKGRNIERFSSSFGNHWLRHDYQKLLDPKIDTFRFSPEYLERKKIIYRQTADHIIATLELDGFLNDKTVHVVILRDEWKDQYDLRYILGLLNSHLMSYLYQYMAQEEGRTFAQVKIFRIKQLPIHAINFSDRADKARHDKMVRLVERMLDLHQQKQAAKGDVARERLEREINVTDEQIDALVYELYGLTKEEIKIVEG